jgi:serine/threonine-protein kinase HipA
MNYLNNISVCPSTLQNNFSSYSPLAIRNIFNGKKVSHILKYHSKDITKEERKLFKEKKALMSISGYQEKYSLKLNGKELEVTDKGGEYILKPIPQGFDNVNQAPANENLTMQIAAQVYGIDTAKNGLIFYQDGEIAYITKRFDVMRNGKRSLKEDFASLSNRTIDGFGKNYKTSGSYFEMANLIDRYIPAAILAKEKLFVLAVFNYLVGNGDAHLKNFSVIDYHQTGLYTLAPAYDLLCTMLHIPNDSDFALEDRLYDGDTEHPSYAKYGFYGYDDFYTLGEMFKMRPQRIEHFLKLLTSKKEQVEELVSRSYLKEEMKKMYLKLYYDKLGRLKTSYKKEYGKD